MEKKSRAVLNISKALMGVSFAALAAIGSASGNLLFAGLSALPAAGLATTETLGSLFTSSRTKKETLLEVPIPNWWTGNAASWQAVCATIENRLPTIIDSLAESLRKEPQGPTNQVVQRAFVHELTLQMPVWDVSAQERSLVAEYMAPQLLKKIVEELESILAPIREEAILKDSHIAAVNTDKIMTMLTEVVLQLKAAQVEMPQHNKNLDSDSYLASISSESAQIGATLAKELRNKMENNTYDVFLCYNTEDADAVKQIGKQLIAHGILPWFDEVDTQPGTPWMAQQEVQLEKIRAAAVFVGPTGIAPWQQIQVYAFLEQFTKRNCPVIPVILAGTSGKIPLPPFLTIMGWVNFGELKPEPLGQLIWGITGMRPASLL
jgi:hypothetical protein